MAHEAASGTRERLHQMKTDTKELDRLNNIDLCILDERTKKTKGWWKKEIQYEDRYYSKKKAIDLGIVTDERFEVE